MCVTHRWEGDAGDATLELLLADHVQRRQVDALPDTHMRLHRGERENERLYDTMWQNDWEKIKGFIYWHTYYNSALHYNSFNDMQTGNK